MFYYIEEKVVDLMLSMCTLTFSIYDFFYFNCALIRFYFILLSVAFSDLKLMRKLSSRIVLKVGNFKL